MQQVVDAESFGCRKFGMQNVLDDKSVGCRKFWMPKVWDAKILDAKVLDASEARFDRDVCALHARPSNRNRTRPNKFADNGRRTDPPWGGDGGAKRDGIPIAPHWCQWDPEVAKDSPRDRHGALSGQAGENSEKIQIKFRSEFCSEFCPFWGPPKTKNTL